MARYRAGVIGLGWMGILYDLAKRRGSAVAQPRFDLEKIDRPTPELDVHRGFYYHDHPGTEGLPETYAEALWDRPEVDLVAGAERDPKRLAAFTERYGVTAGYADAEEMLRKENLDIVAIATNTKWRPDLTCLAVEQGAKGIFTEKPMAHTLEEADRMVKTCADAGVPLNCGAISTNHPSFVAAKELVTTGAIGDIVSIEAGGVAAQHQNWSFFLDSAAARVWGTGDPPQRETGSDEFYGQGMMETVEGLVVHFRKGVPGIRLTGTAGEIFFRGRPGWSLSQDVDTPAGKRRADMPWPGPQFGVGVGGGGGVVYGLADVIDCMEGRLDEPKNSGRRVAVALEVEVAIKLSSARGGAPVDLPIEDRSLGLTYDWHR